MTTSNMEAVLSPSLTISALVLAISLYILTSIFFPSSRSSLGRIPGPWQGRLTDLYMLYQDRRGQRVRTLKRLHDKYGPVIRIGSNEISFSSLTAQRTIFGAGSPFERTAFYRPFDVYGVQNLFTFGPTFEHRERKKLVSHIYANRTILSPEHSAMIEEKSAQYLQLLDRAKGEPTEIFSTLHYFSIDAISTFVYGPDNGGTTALLGNPAHVSLLNDILDPSRRNLAFFAIHFPKLTKWLYSPHYAPVSFLLNRLHLIPMTPPTTYSGIRAHALKACMTYLKDSAPKPSSASTPVETVISRLRTHQLTHPSSLSDLDIASECADHLLAGIDTTADTLLFLFWALSLPRNAHIQSTLRAELLGVSTSFDPVTGIAPPKALTGLPYLNAVIKETLRLYSPLPGTEPRTCRTETVIDGFRIPAGTVVGMAPYVLHRDEKAYPHPLVFDPERWLREGDGKMEAGRQFWAFGSGARMCIGIHLAMAEMLAITAGVYRRFRSVVREGEGDVGPGVTSRFEVFYDEEVGRMVEHECWIKFERL